MQFEAVQRLSVSPALIFPLQCSGGTMGNVICVINIVAETAAVGAGKAEGRIVNAVNGSKLLRIRML